MPHQSFSPFSGKHGCHIWSALDLRDYSYDHTRSKFTSPSNHYSFSTKTTGCLLWSALDLRELLTSIRNSPLKAHLRTLIPPTVQKSVSVPPVPFRSCLHQRNIIRKFFQFTRPFDLNMKIHFKTTPREKDYVHHPERTLDDILSTIHGFPS